MARFRYDSDDPTDPANYTLDNTTQCQGINALCAIHADADASNKPIITPDLISEMLIAVVTHTPQPGVVELKP